MAKKDAGQPDENIDRPKPNDLKERPENNREGNVETKVKNASASGLGSIGRNDEKLDGSQDDSLNKY
jgi:hypothetical protein